MASRGNAISAYSAPFSKGAKIYGANIQSGVVTSAHIADGTIIAADVAAGSITSAKLGTDAVTSVKLAAASVISAKLGVSAVQNTNIAANAIRAGAISAKAVTSAKIRAAFLSGTLVSGKTMFAVAHGLGVRPKMVVACAIVTRTQASAATPSTVNIGVSAATSTNIYLIASGTINASVKYAAYVQL
mgnify:CR=1 FL=1